MTMLPARKVSQSPGSTPFDIEIPPHVAVSQFVQKAKGRSSFKAQQEFPELRKRYWGKRFWARGYFCTTSGNITDDIILAYLDRHDQPH